MSTPFRSSLILSVLLLMALPAAAQTPESETPEPPPNVAEPPTGDINETPAESEPISLSGCLQREQGGDAFVLTRTAGSDTPQPVAPDREGEGTSPGRPTAPGTAVEQPAPEEQPALSTYRLLPGERDVELGDHVGHQVQVEGRLQAAPPGLIPPGTRSGESQVPGTGSTPAPEAPSTAEPGAAPSAQILTTLEVTSLRMIDDTCDVTRD